ncbi:MAG: DUF1289 domain-containing protein [Gammaproteobacteria bacterium]|nr:DUF1289 domain-containing protein [Gammaproteobacteria bacterium]
MPVNSPCINICVMDAETGYCVGCFRTIEEISKWPRLPSEQRAEIIHQLERRRQSAEE